MDNLNIKNINLTFDDKYHIYRFNGSKCISVSALIKNYAEPFEREKWSKHVATRDGMTQQQVLDMWKAKANKAASFGTLIHKYAENYINGDTVPLLKTDKEKKYAKQVELFINKYNLIPVATELKLCSPQHLVAGTIDLVMINKGGDFIIFDWKTNEKIDKVNDYGRKLLSPFDFSDDCGLSKYSLQLGCYKKLLEINGIKIKSMFMLWLKDDNCEAIKCNDFSKEINLIFKDLIKD